MSGGYTAGNRKISDSYLFDCWIETWTKIFPLPHAMSGHSIAVRLSG